MRGNAFVIYDSPDQLEFLTDVNKNALVFYNRKLSGKFTNADFRYKVAPLIVAKGHSEVDMNTIDVEVGLALSTRVLADGKVVAYVTPVDVHCNINRFDINIKLWGNALTDIASLFEVFFVGTVAGVIESSVLTALNTVLPNLINAGIAKTDGALPIPIPGRPGFKLDWQTPINPQVTSLWAGITMDGTFFDSLVGEIPSTGAVPSMPVHNDTHLEAFQNYISAYAVDSLLSSVFEYGPISGILYSTGTENYFNLTTSSLNTLLPGIETYYGANVPVDVHWSIINLQNWHSYY